MTGTVVPVIGITLGDPAGIGPEVVRAALNSGRLDESCEYRIIGKIPPNNVPGQPDAADARAALLALEESVELWRRGEIQAVVTAPVSKERLTACGFPFPGQTEFFAERCGVRDYAMCLTGPHLTVGLVTIHEPLSRVPSLLTAQGILEKGRLLADFCRRRGMSAPRIAVAGLNPHAGENGQMGTEEITLIRPAVEALNAEQRQHLNLSGEVKAAAVFYGPLPPDTLFYQAARGDYDAVLCMYHDQGLIPLKLLDFEEGVNVTLGLPLIRTSPDHGTAFDIAGKGLAKPDSMIAAIRLAAELVDKGARASRPL